MNRDCPNPIVSVAVSGVGLVSPLAPNREGTWSRILSAESGIRATPKGLEAQVLDFSPNGARSRMGDFALMAAGEALAHAGLTGDELEKAVVGCAVSQSKPLVSHPLDPSLLMSTFFGWSAEAVVKRAFQLDGPSGNTVSACATGVTSLDLGRHWIETGRCDVVLAGAAESSLNDFYRAGFRQMDVLAHGTHPTCVKPFSRGRSGFAMGEGAAILVLEREGRIRSRGRRPLARLARTVLQHSSHDAIRFDPDGSAVARLVRCVTGGADRVGYVNAHGTATLLNDRAETKGLKTAFGRTAYEIPVSSTKAATGHLLGAAGALEAAVCVLALRDQVIPPTLNLDQMDPECDLDYAPGKARPARFDNAVSLSYGFGGQMGAVLFERCKS